MKNRVKAIALFVGLLFLLGSMVPVVAFDGFKTLKAQFKNYKLVVDGRQIVTKDEPFMVDGRIYVPVRVAAEATGADVDWDGANGRVLITTNKKLIEDKYLKDFATEREAIFNEGFWKGFLEGQKIYDDKKDKEDEYEKGYNDGVDRASRDGFIAGEKDFNDGRRSDWERALETDRRITSKYNLTRESDDYRKGFLAGYKDEFRNAYYEGYESDEQYDYGYEDGYRDGYYDGYKTGEDDAWYGRYYRPNAPSRRTIITEYRLDSKNDKYQKGFIDGYWDNYSKGYDDGYEGKRANPFR